MPPINRRQITVEEARKRLETLCARAERCTFELQQKLRQWNIAPEDAEALLQYLAEGRWVDDARFARAFVRDKVYLQHKGRLYVAKALMVKRIPRATIMEAMAEIDEARYADSLDAVLRAKVRSNPALLESYEGRTKLFRHAASRGFEASLISDALRSICSSTEV